MTFDFYINFGSGFTKVSPPLNWQQLQIEVVFDNDNPSASLKGLDFDWVGENAVKMHKYRQDGISGVGVGILEGLPLQIKTCSNNSITIFDGVIDLSKAKWECDMVSAPSQESGRIDWLNDIAASFSFHYLRSLTGNQAGRIIPATDFKLTPYCITEIPDYTQALTCSVSLFILLKELYETTKNVANLISKLVGDASTAVATGGLATPNLVAQIAIIIAEVAYLALIIVECVQLVDMIIENIIQRKKHKACMRVATHFERACQYLGLSFNSSILQQGTYKDVTYMPRKTVIPDKFNPLNVFDRPMDESTNFPLNNDVYGYHEGTFKDFIVDMMQVFNADVKIIGNTLSFERRNSRNNPNPYVIPNVGNVGNTYNLPDPHVTNADELSSSMFIIYSTDESELNTLHRYRGTSLQALIKPNIINNRKNVLLKNAQEIRLPVAMARRKEYLTRIENLVNTIINALFSFVNAILTGVNALINAVNAVLNIVSANPPTVPTIPLLPTNILNNRVDWLALSNDSFSIPKLFLGRQNGNDWVLQQTSEIEMAAEKLFDRFWKYELATHGNQALMYRDKTWAFCCEDFLQIIGSNIIKDPLGRNGKLQSLLWDCYNDRAVNVNYKIFTNFTNNLNEKLIIDGN